MSFLVMFVFVFFAIASVYGATSGGLPDLQSTMNQITGPWPTSSNSNCSSSLNGRTDSQNILNTAYFGMIWILASIRSIVFRMRSGYFDIYQLAHTASPLT